MTVLARFLRNESGGSAAEFALILPVFLLFLLGMIDVGRYVWAINEAEKATQIGTRWAVATDMIPTGLADYSFATDPAVPIPQGDPVPESSFPGVRCGSEGGTVSCTCLGSCEFDTSASTEGEAAFDALVERMRTIYPHIDSDGDDVVVEYLYSGLGFAGDPNGPDVSPLVRVRLLNQTYPLFLMFGGSVPLPSFAYTLTNEDGSGTFSNY